MLSPNEVVARFEGIAGRQFKREHIADEALHAQLEGATDPLQKSFAGLMLSYSSGDAINMTSIQKEFRIVLTSVDQYARGVLGHIAAA